MWETAKKSIKQRRFGIITIGLCLLFMSALISAADLSQPVWPAPNPVQWYWYEPETNLTLEEADTIFKKAVAAKVYLCFPQFPISTIQIEKPKKSIKIVTKLVGSIPKEQYQYFLQLYPKGIATISLNDIQKVFLFYVSNTASNNKWLLRIMTADSIHDLLFTDEASARMLGNAAASVHTQEGFSLKFPKLGIFTADLTPAQAEALGKTKIDSVLVTLVAIDGPADKANIQPLDVITAVNEIKINNASHFNTVIDGIASGTRIALACLQRTVTVVNDQKQFVWKPNVCEVTVK